MTKRPKVGRFHLASHLYLGAFLAMISSAAIAQILPPGQLPPGPPAQPGQLGPAPKSSQPSTPETGPAATEPAPAGEQPSSADQPRIVVPVRYVLVPTTVFDPDGHGYVNGLTTRDFEVYDNDKLQKINADFSQQPLSVVLVVQANSEIEPLLPKIKKAGVLLQGLVTGAEGDAAILAFDHRMQHLQDFTSDAGRLDDAMQKVTAGSNTAAIIDAVLEADHMLKRHDPRNIRRRVILLLSRDIDKGSEAHLQETVRDMQFDNVIVYSVNISRVATALLDKPGYPPRQNGGVPPEALPNLRGNGAYSETQVIQQENGNILNGAPPLLHSIHDLFKKSPGEAFSYFTGGRMYSFATEKALAEAITDIGKDLNSQYLLSYAPNDKNEPGFHNIKVVVDRPGLKIRTRPGYWWGGVQ